MSHTQVKSYTDKQLLEHVININGFNGLPQGYWILAIRSNEDVFDVFDDKFYIFKGSEFIDVMTGTTNTGSYGLKAFTKWNKNGAAIIKSNEWYYDVYQKGLHRGKMTALRQVGKMKYYRDGNKDKKIDEVGTIYEDNYYTNFHTNDYTMTKGIKTWVIGGWSVGCLVSNNIEKYYNFLSKVGYNKVSLCLIKEF